MQSFNYHLLMSIAKDKDKYLIIKALLEKEIKQIENYKQFDNNFCAVLIDSKTKTYLTVYDYKEHIFIGIYNLQNKKIYFYDNGNVENISKLRIGTLFLKFQNNALFKTYENANIQLENAWKRVIPLLDKVIDIEENYERYKKEYNQYKELNIPNNGFIGDKEDYINQCVFLFECYQTIDDSKASIDFNSMSIFKNNIPYISIKDGQIQNNFDKTEIKNSLNKLVDEYIDTLQDEIQNQFNLLHKEQGLVPITNFKGQYRIYNIKNDKDKNIFHYEIENDNINQLLDCKMKLSSLRLELQKEQQKSIAYEDMDSIENEIENNIDNI